MHGVRRQVGNIFVCVVDWAWGVAQGDAVWRGQKTQAPDPQRLRIQSPTQAKSKTAAIFIFTFGFALLLFEKVKLQKAKPPVAFLGFRSG